MCSGEHNREYEKYDLSKKTYIEGRYIEGLVYQYGIFKGAELRDGINVTAWRPFGLMPQKAYLVSSWGSTVTALEMSLEVGIRRKVLSGMIINIYTITWCKAIHTELDKSISNGRPSSWKTRRHRPVLT